MELEDSINERFDLIKAQLIKQCHAVPLKYVKGNPNKRERAIEAFKEAAKVWKLQNEFATEKRKFDRAFMFTHIFIRIVLAESLHRRQEPEFKKISAAMLSHLQEVEALLEQYVSGIKQQIEFLLRHEEQLKMKKQQKQEEKEREEMRKREEEKNKFENIAPATIAATTTTVPITTNQLDSVVPSPTSTSTKPIVGENISLVPPADPPSNPIPNQPKPSAINPNPSLPSVSTPLPSYPSLDGVDTPKLPPVVAPAVPVSPATVAAKPVVAKAVDPFDKLPFSAFREKTITGDGHCAFRSVVQGEAKGSLPGDVETRKALDLRKQVVKDLWAKRSKDLKGMGLTVEQLVTMDGKHSTLRDYLNGMSKNDFAGEVELILMAQYLNRPIFVYKKEDNCYRRMSKYLDKGDPICLLWKPGAFSEAGNHYNLLLKN